ncbi:YvrJ family protein [Shouchella shacheensis]|uniref:YvrJ family protein n=1 Tax=Shouchella shacheensis TaxID=1649580 RepID=UPI000740277E|nr:YvrJ family protein [Shouchella shacheensis]
MEEWIKLISNVGFPIAVASYLLVRLEPVIKDLQRSISGLTVVISKQNEVTQRQVMQVLGKGERES